VQPRVKSIGELCREGFYGADPHINGEGAGKVHVHRSAVQEKEQHEGGEEQRLHADGKRRMEESGGKGIRQDHCCA